MRLQRWFVRAVGAVVAGILTAATIAAPPLQRQIGGFPSIEKVELGRKLFFDSRLSSDNSTSCATCHDPRLRWSDGRPRAVGMREQFVGPRRTPTLLHVGYDQLMFWDGRTDTIEQQALQPLVNPIEMGNNSVQQVVNRVGRNPGYQRLFLEAYGTPGVTRQRMAECMAQFQSTIISRNAPIDRYLAGDQFALTPDQKAGFDVFVAASCVDCHQPPHFTDHDFHNCGTSFFFDTDDDGRGGVLSNQDRTAQDIRAFKTPTLRDIGRASFFFHAGNVGSLEETVRYFNLGGVRPRDGRRDRFTDPRVRPLNLTTEQERQLVEFLRFGLLSEEYPMIRQPALP